ncbi:hypothetical protein DM02DRAFT_520497, partial [Periconia macrospinosa]
ISPPKKKGNPIITRYPPPPGYRGPAQPQGAFGAQQHPTQYQHGQLSYQQGLLGNSAYPNHGYQPPTSQGHSVPVYGHVQSTPQSAYPSPGYHQASSYSLPQQPQQGYSQHPNYPGSQNYASSQRAYPDRAVQAPTANQNQLSWPQPHPSTNYPKHHSISLTNSLSSTRPIPDPDATPIPTPVHPTTSRKVPLVLPPKSTVTEESPKKKTLPFSPCDDWDFEFDGAIWPKANEPVDPDLSLGVIIWRPAKQVTRALPSNFADAEEQVLKPPPERLGNGESVSIYFTAENSHEAFLNVRQTDEWYKICKDPVFVVFTDEDMARNLVPIEDCIALRDRPDEPLEGVKEENEEMHDASWNIMDHLEQALSRNSDDEKAPTTKGQNGFVENQNQEDILAKLGVTGTPKPPSNEQVPVSFFAMKTLASLSEKPPKPISLTKTDYVRTGHAAQKAHSHGGPHNTAHGQDRQYPFKPLPSMSNYRTGPSNIQQYDPWNHVASLEATFDPAENRSRGSPARSEGSNKTAVGSDFESTKSPARNVDQLRRSDSSSTRKRSHQDTQEEEQGPRVDDHIKRKRLSQADSVYR